MQKNKQLEETPPLGYALNFHLKCSKGNKASSYQTAVAEKTYCEAAVL